MAKNDPDRRSLEEQLASLDAMSREQGGSPSSEQGTPSAAPAEQASEFPANPWPASPPPLPAQPGPMGYAPPLPPDNGPPSFAPPPPPPPLTAFAPYGGEPAAQQPGDMPPEYGSGPHSAGDGQHQGAPPYAAPPAYADPSPQGEQAPADSPQAEAAPAHPQGYPGQPIQDGQLPPHAYQSPPSPDGPPAPPFYPGLPLPDAASPGAPSQNQPFPGDPSAYQGQAYQDAAASSGAPAAQDQSFSGDPSAYQGQPQQDAASPMGTPAAQDQSFSGDPSAYQGQPQQDAASPAGAPQGQAFPDGSAAPGAPPAYQGRPYPGPPQPYPPAHYGSPAPQQGPPLAPLPPLQEVPQRPPTAPPTSESLSAETLLRERKTAPSGGWRRMIFKATGGAIRPGESAAERRRRELIARARTPVVGGHHRVAVMSLKGGVGKTTTTVGLGATLASLRGDRVIAVDANPDRGTLSDKVRLETDATVRDLLNERDQIQRYADVRAFTSQAPSRLEVLASDRDPAVSEAFSAEDYRAVAEVLEQFYSICITDCGTGLLHSAMAGVLSLADQLVLVSSPSVDGARSASATLDWLDAHGHGDLVRSGVVVLSMVRARSKSSVDLDKLQEHFESRCRAVVRVPYDDHLEEGAEVDLDQLSPACQDAYLQLAAIVADGFAWPR